MPRAMPHAADHHPGLTLRSRGLPGPLSRDMKRFDIFLIDTGWNEPVSKVVRSHLPLVYEYQRQDSLFLLTPEQSVEVLRREPRLIGRDPTIVVYDLYAPADRKVGRYRGFRLNLGRFRRPEQVLGGSRSSSGSSTSTGPPRPWRTRCGGSCTARGCRGWSGCSARRPRRPSN